MAGELIRPASSMYGEAARMQDAVTALLDTYLEEYGTRLKAYNALIKDLDLKKGAKLAAEVKGLTPAQDTDKSLEPVNDV